MKGETRLADALPELVSAAINKIASFAALALGVTFAYFLYALLTGYVRAYPQLDRYQQYKVYNNLNIASYLFLVAAVLLVGYALLQLWEHSQFALGLAFIGAVFHFGAPFVIAQAVGAALRGNWAAYAIQRGFSGAGQVMLIAAVIWGIPALVEQVRTGLAGIGEESATRRAAKKQAGLVHPFSPCWKLPYCRPYIRDKCPRFQERKTCWRTKSGCMCDDDIMSSALMGGAETKSGAREKLITEFLPGAGGRSSGQKKVKCQNCFIYLEHQRIKHKHFAPLMIPLVGVIFWQFAEPIQAIYTSFGAWASRAVIAISLNQVDANYVGMVQQTFANPGVKWLILACVAMYLLTYLLRLMEFLFFKLKI